MPRADLSNDLVHWIKGDSNEEAFEILRAIVRERRLLGGVGHIRGGYTCICFTEAPEGAFHQIIGRYRPFGVRVPKTWLFSRGGRPVIYQPDDEYDLLPEQLRWRHMRYEPTRAPPVDFSWEREWRIQTPELQLPFGEASLLVPHESWARELQGEHENAEEARIDFEARAYGDEWFAWQEPEPFGYVYSVINV
jgi:hypothetical protein